jgi:hypothetical protein
MNAELSLFEGIDHMQVFISHSSKDEELVRSIADALKEAGMEVWDDREILPGENWAAKTAEALEESQAMVVLLTPDALNSKSMEWEVEYALGKMAYNKRVVPVLVGDPQEFQRHNIPWIFKHLKMIYLPGQGQNKESIKQIAEAIQEAA